MAILIRGDNSSKVLPIQPLAAHFYMAVLVSGLAPQMTFHWSLLQPTPTWKFWSGGGGGISSKVSHCSPLLHGNFGRGVYFPKSPPIAAQLLHHFNTSEQNTPTLLHQFTPRRRIIPSLSYNKMNGFYGGRQTRVICRSVVIIVICSALKRSLQPHFTLYCQFCYYPITTNLTEICTLLQTTSNRSTSNDWLLRHSNQLIVDNPTGISWRL